MINSGDEDVLTVATVNLLSPEHAAWPRRRELLRAGLARLRPDVLALQEAVWGDEHADQVGELLDEGFTLLPHSVRSPNGVGAVLATRWPVGAVRELDLRVTDRVDLPWAAVVVAEIELPTPFGRTVFVHHKPTYCVGSAWERELQAVAAARFVEDQLAGQDHQVVLLGDFDDTPDSASVRFWTGKQSLDGCSVAYRDAWDAVHPDEPGHTFTPRNPLVRAGEMALELGRRIDYIMIRCGSHGPALEVADCELIFDQPVDGIWATDHCGLVSRLRVPEHRPGSWVS